MSYNGVFEVIGGGVSQQVRLEEMRPPYIGVPESNTQTAKIQIPLNETLLDNYSTIYAVIRAGTLTQDLSYRPYPINFDWKIR